MKSYFELNGTIQRERDYDTPVKTPTLSRWPFIRFG